MKIAQIVDKIKNGAVDNNTLTLAEDFARLGHESHVLTWSDNNHRVRELDPRVRLSTVNIKGLTSTHSVTRLARPLLRSWLGRKRYLSVIAPLLSREFNRVLSQGGYDICLLQEHHVFPLLKLDLPTLLVARNMRSRQMPAGSLFHRLYARHYPRLHIIGVSEGVVTDLIRSLHLAPEHLTAIHNPIDRQMIQRKAQSLPEQLPEPGSFIIAVGRNTPQKRFDRLLRAYAVAGIDQQLVILGNACRDPKLYQLARELGISERVQFAGYQDNPYPWIKAARALVMTSDFEGFGMVLAEALACGTPAVSTDCPSGPNEILTGELSRWLVPVNDEQMLAAKIREVVMAPPNIPANAIERFDRTTIAKRYLATMERHLQGLPIGLTPCKPAN